MAQIDQKPDERHRRFQELLPWLANGTLDASERAEVERHLDDCAACRAELATEARLRDSVAELSIASDVCWNRPSEYSSNSPPWPARSNNRARWMRRTAIGRAFARPGKAGWIIGAQAAALVLVVSVDMSGGRSSFMNAEGVAPYQTLSSAPATIDGNVIVMFDPMATTSDMRAALDAADARIIGGPTVTGGYILHVAGERRGAVLAKLRTAGAVMLAEPIEGSTPR